MCFLPQRKLFTAIRISVQRDKSQKGDVSQFGALATALAATIGTGNIIGVATAVALGGPGAVFWCWLTGVFGISTKYSEALLAIKYRVKSESGRMLGGPMYTQPQRNELSVAKKSLTLSISNVFSLLF